MTPEIKDLADPTPDILHTAEAALRRLGSAAVQPLCEALPKLEPKAQARACTLLGELGRCDEQAFEALKAVASNPGEARWAALEALTAVAGARAIPILGKILDTADDSVSALVADLLGNIRSKDAFELLSKLIDEAPDRVRAAACKSLGRLGYSEALPVLFKALGDPDTKTCSEAFNSILKFGVAGIELLLETAKNHKDPRWRAAALPVARHIDSAQCKDLLEAALVGHELVAEQAATLLGSLRGRFAVEPLIEALDRRPEVDVQIAVIKALGCLGDVRAIEPLKTLCTIASKSPKTYPPTKKTLERDEFVQRRGELEADVLILGEDGEKEPAYEPHYKQNAFGFGYAKQAKPGFVAEDLAEIPVEAESALRQIEESNEIQKVYPDIQATNDHPVTGEVIKLEVTLNKHHSLSTNGITVLPNAAPDFVFKMRVHLLCADTSEWQDLDYCKAHGTIKPAQFTITAPKLTPDAQRYIPIRGKLSIRANFYYENRWCGEGRRDLDLRKTKFIEEMDLDKPELSNWQKFINIEQGTQPADLLVRILHQHGDQYIWSHLSPHLEFTGGFETGMEIPDGAEAWVKTLFEPFANVDLTDLMQADIEGIGKIIYDSTPEAFKKAYWKLVDELEHLGIIFNSILFISDESCVPWELMRVAQKGVSPEFLGIRHAVGRWIAEASSRLVQNISIRKFVVAGSGYPDFPPINQLPWVEGELDWLMQHYKPQRITLQSKPILDFLETGIAQAVHFACHGQNSNKNSLLNELIMEDNPNNIKTLNINRPEVQEGLGAQHPIIFLNACQAAKAGKELGLIVGLPAAFLAAGASAVICPLWRISDEHAKEITEQFYQAAFAQSGKTLGEVLQTIRKQWESERHLTFLAYVLYGDPQARIDFSPQP